MQYAIGLSKKEKARYAEKNKNTLDAIPAAIKLHWEQIENWYNCQITKNTRASVLNDYEGALNACHHFVFWWIQTYGHALGCVKMPSFEMQA